MKSLKLSGINTALTSSSLSNELRKMDEAQRIWARDLQSMNMISEQIRKLTESNSLAIQVAEQLQLMEKHRLDNIRMILDPLADIHKSFLVFSSLNRQLENIGRPRFLGDEIARIAKEFSYASLATKAMQESMQPSFVHAQQMIASASITTAFSQAMKTFKEAQKRWTVPNELIDSIGALKAIEEQVGKLTLPVLDLASAATLAKVLGPEGLEAQLAVLGIGPDGALAEDTLAQEELGIGLSRKNLELMALLSFILAVLVPIYQEFSSREWQQQTDKTLETQGVMLETQARQLESLSKLVEKALVQEAKRTGQRFVVKDRVAVVRSKPEHGSLITGKLLPREVVRPIFEQGKWVQFEYYHWLLQDYQVGWALKKYFRRVPATYNEDISR